MGWLRKIFLRGFQIEVVRSTIEYFGWGKIVIAHIGTWVVAFISILAGLDWYWAVGGGFVVSLLITFVSVIIAYKVGRSKGVEPLVSERSQWQQEWHELQFQRRDFWRLLSTAYSNWPRKTPNQSLQDMMVSAQYPLELPLSDGSHYPKWVWDAPKKWTGAALKADEFASGIYPATTRLGLVKSQLMGTTHEFDRFDDIRMGLSKFWDHWGRQEPLEQVIREQKTDSLIKSSAAEIKLLTFLEIARSRREQTGASGKGGLFRLGRRNEETES